VVLLCYYVQIYDGSVPVRAQFGRKRQTTNDKRQTTKNYGGGFGFVKPSPPESGHFLIYFPTFFSFLSFYIYSRSAFFAFSALSALIRKAAEGVFGAGSTGRPEHTAPYRSKPYIMLEYNTKPQTKKSVFDSNLFKSESDLFKSEPDLFKSEPDFPTPAALPAGGAAFFLFFI
jgi:hypothetical protein